MTKVYRQIVDNVIVNRAVFADTGMPSDWPNPEQWEEETEENPPDIGWVRPGPDEQFEPPPEAETKPAE